MNSINGQKTFDKGNGKFVERTKNKLEIAMNIEVAMVKKLKHLKHLPHRI